jgi:hypothetical protein
VLTVRLIPSPRRRLAGWIPALCVLIATLAACATGRGGAAVDLPDEGIPPSADRRLLIFAIQNMPLEEMGDALGEIRDFYGPNDPRSRHAWGFSLFSLMLLKQSEEELSAIVHHAFDLAEQFDVPVFLHLDMLHNPPTGDDFEGPPRPFFEDPMMCEWVGFPGPGEEHGPVPRYWCNWGSWFSAPAFPCFTSPDLRELITAQLADGVLAPLHERLARLSERHREDLFAGISIGWETHIPDYTPGQPFVSIDPDDPPVDRFAKPPITMQTWEMGQLGYAALHHLGYDQDRLEREAIERGVSVRALFIELGHEVTHDYTEFLARCVFESGIPRSRIFSHTIAISSVDPVPSTFSPPIGVAVNPYCTPGFTLDNFGAAVYDLEQLRQEIRLADPDLEHFAVAETYFRRGCTEPEITGFFDEVFGGGASLVHILAWHSARHPNSPFYVPLTMAGPHLSVAKWLRAGRSR